MTTLHAIKSDANLARANLAGAPIIDGGLRSDGYRFWATNFDGNLFIQAGCRVFDSFAAARAHWTKTRGGTQLGVESLCLVDHLERMADARKWPVKPKQEAAA